MNPNNEQVLLEKIRRGDEAALRQVYLLYREEGIRWVMKQFKCAESDAQEIFQVSVVTLYDNVATGKLTDLTSQLKTYLFGICRNKGREWLRTVTKTDFVHESMLRNLTEDEDTLDDVKAKEQLYQRVERGFQQLGEQCRNLIQAFYYHQQSTKTIAEEMGYKNPNAVKTAKYKCLQKLKKYAHEAQVSIEDISKKPNK